jgi:5'-deoxynucleotidase YfbR-like HD superfamily hydrolase
MFTEEQIFEETKKIQYLYGLKYEIRYAQERGDETESVAEHIYGMHILAHYFLPLENPEGNWSKDRIFSMITWHDMDELETGDMLGYKKTASDRAREDVAMNEVLVKLPSHLKTSIEGFVTEYQRQETIESQFVKAIDKIEPLFHLFNDAGKQTLHKNKTTNADHLRIKLPYIQQFKIITEFNTVLVPYMYENGFFYDSPVVQ